jgi:hypothetical protein
MRPIPETRQVLGLRSSTISTAVVGYRWKGWPSAAGAVVLLWVTFGVTRLFVMSAGPLAHLVAGS